MVLASDSLNHKLQNSTGQILWSLKPNVLKFKPFTLFTYVRAGSLVQPIPSELHVHPCWNQLPRHQRCCCLEKGLLAQGANRQIGPCLSSVPVLSTATMQLFHAAALSIVSTASTAGISYISTLMGSWEKEELLWRQH